MCKYNARAHAGPAGRRSAFRSVHFGASDLGVYRSHVVYRRGSCEAEAVGVFWLGVVPSRIISYGVKQQRCWPFGPLCSPGESPVTMEKIGRIHLRGEMEKLKKVELELVRRGARTACVMSW
jgi:hypothetical protein